MTEIECVLSMFAFSGEKQECKGDLVFFKVHNGVRARCARHFWAMGSSTDEVERISLKEYLSLVVLHE